MKTKLKAFSLLEVSIVLIVFGMMSSLFVKSFSTFTRLQKNKITEQNIEKIYSALGIFAANMGYLPFPHVISNKNICPVFGIESTPISDNDIILESESSAIKERQVGIVPFLTLGLDENDVKDGNGNYFTYSINIVLGRRRNHLYLPYEDARIKFEIEFEPEGPHENNDDFFKLYNYRSKKVDYVRKACGFCSSRYYSDDFSNLKKITNSVVNKHQGYVFQRAPREKLKYYAGLADLSCWVNNLTVFDRNGSNVSKQIKKNIYRVAVDKFAQVQEGKWSDYYDNKHIPFTDLEAYKICDTVAVVLVSHGKNGGSFLKSGRKIPLNKKALKSNSKISNDNNSPIFYQSDNNNPQSFDDKVFFISKFSLASLYGNFLCQSYSFWKVNKYSWTANHVSYAHIDEIHNVGQSLKREILRDNRTKFIVDDDKGRYLVEKLDG